MLKTPTRVVSIVPSRVKAGPTELNVLDAYVETIRLWSSQPAQLDSIRFESVEVAVHPWVARAIQRFCNSPNPTKGEIEDLVTQGVAVIAWCRTELGPRAHASQAELVLNAAVGMLVVGRLQKLCNTLLSRGDHKNVKELNQFQHEVRNVVQQVRNTLEANEKQPAKELASPSLDEAGTGTNDSPVEASRTPRPRQGATTSPANARSQVVFLKQAPVQPSRFRSYVFRFVVCSMLVGLVAYGLTTFREPSVQDDAPESLTAAVSNMPEVTEVQDRMPYIVLMVRDGFWEETSEPRQEDWVEDLSQLAKRDGYSGLLVRSTSGTLLAEWVRGRGIQLSGKNDRS